MKPIFCGNFEYDARQTELERLFRRYGRVDRVDMKSGYAFVYMEDERDGEDAIRGLDRIEFGRKGRRLRVEWTKHERGIRRPGGPKRSTNLKPSKTLFVINFDPYHTRARDLERHFDPYGKIVNVRIRRNFAFVQFEAQEDAMKALDATHMSKLLDRVISVEFAIRDDDDRGNGYSPDRVRDRSPVRRTYGSGRGRSPSPYRMERGSPDYGHNPRESPYRRTRTSPDYGHRHSSPSPLRRERANTDSVRDLSSSPRGRGDVSFDDGRDTSLHPSRRDGHGNSPRSHRRDGYSPSPRSHRRHDYSPSPKPHRRNGHDLSSSPPPKGDAREHSPGTLQVDDGRKHSPSPRKRSGLEVSPTLHRRDSLSSSPPRRRDVHDLSPIPCKRDGGDHSPSSPGGNRDGSPIPKVELNSSPNYGEESPPPAGYSSPSPARRERSRS